MCLLRRPGSSISLTGWKGQEIIQGWHAKMLKGEEIVKGCHPRDLLSLTDWNAKYSSLYYPPKQSFTKGE